MGCTSPSGGALSPLIGLDAGPEICGDDGECVAGQRCGPSGVCVPCPDGRCSEEQDGGTEPSDAGADASDQSPSDDLGVDDATMSQDADAPNDAQSCQPRPEACNELDDDCDGRVDESFDLVDNVEHCGVCGNVCSDAMQNAVTSCREGLCILVSCQPGWEDADQIPGNGCETARFRIEMIAPIASAVFEDDITVTLEIEGADMVGVVTLTANNVLVDRRAPAATMSFSIPAGQFDDGVIDIRATATDLNGEVLDSLAVSVTLDRTAPVVDFLSPGPGLRRGTDPIEVAVRVRDADPEVSATLFINGEELAALEPPEFSLALDPLELGSGPHELRAVAQDSSGRSGADERQIVLSFCATDEMVQLPGMDALIDRYEASLPDASANQPGTDTTTLCSTPGVLPWSGMNFFDAEAACEASGKRLCTPPEWRRACGGLAQSRYPYGDVFRLSHCNGVENPDTVGHVVTGSLENCVTEDGIYDLSGNLAEWTGPDVNIEIVGVMGGSYTSRDFALECTSRQEFQEIFLNPTNGVRCCRDL